VTDRPSVPSGPVSVADLYAGLILRATYEGRRYNWEAVHRIGDDWAMYPLNEASLTVVEHVPASDLQHMIVL
jgi:hypothetical protein